MESFCCIQTAFAAVSWGSVSECSICFSECIYIKCFYVVIWCQQLQLVIPRITVIFMLSSVNLVKFIYECCDIDFKELSKIHSLIFWWHHRCKSEAMNYETENRSDFFSLKATLLQLVQNEYSMKRSIHFEYNRMIYSKIMTIVVVEKFSFMSIV